MLPFVSPMLPFMSPTLPFVSAMLPGRIQDLKKEVRVFLANLGDFLKNMAHKGVGVRPLHLPLNLCLVALHVRHVALLIFRQ